MQKDKLIQELTQRLKRQQKNYLSVLNEQQQLKSKVKKLPYSMFKDFIIFSDIQGNILSSEEQSNDNNKQSYILFKITGKSQPIYLSSNVQVTTIDKLKLKTVRSQTQDQSSIERLSQESYEFKVEEHESQKHIKHKNKHKNKQDAIELKMCSKQITVKIQGIIPNKNKIISEHKQEEKPSLELLNMKNKNSNNDKKQFSLKPLLNLERKQSLPLTQECRLLSNQLNSLRQKVTEYTKVLENSQLSISDPLADLSGIQNINIEEYQLDKKLKEQQDGLSQILTDSWKVEKNQYIDYIQQLEKQLNEIKNHGYKFSFNDKSEDDKYQGTNRKNMQPNNGKNFKNGNTQKRMGQSSFLYPSPIKNQAYSEQSPSSNVYFKSPGLLSENKSDPNLNSAQSFLKSSNLGDNQRAFYKNQYHINQSRSQQKIKPKSKSKIVYLGR